MLVFRFILSLLFLSGLVQAQQLFPGSVELTKKDTIRGSLSPLRDVFDVSYYHLDLRIDPEKKYISGSNLIRFVVLQEMKVMQIDLFDTFTVNSVTIAGVEAKYTREYNALFIELPQLLKKGTIHDLNITYEGHPLTAQRPPWDGGFIWEKTEHGKHWIGVACEGLGASSWWPCKDHLSDEPDSMLISIAVPSSLTNVSNGRLRKTQVLTDGYTRFDWFVSYPINNYNVSINIAPYEHYSETFNGASGPLTLDYFVLPGNTSQAKEHFSQVRPMMKCFEYIFGPYPFYQDGYKLVQTPYLGMEHQSCIAYGNNFMSGYMGMDYSYIGLPFDYIIIHESGHEWWGNLVSVKDIADLWIHEGFCTYSEAMYVECLFGKDRALDYIQAKIPTVENTTPLVGLYGVNREGSGDMYNKGMLMLNTLRTLVNDDELWYNLLKAIPLQFGYKTTSTSELVEFINTYTKADYSWFFNHYLFRENLPELEYRFIKTTAGLSLEYRINGTGNDFNMPIKVLANETPLQLMATPQWTSTPLPQGFHKKKDRIEIDERLYYISVKTPK